MTELKSVLIIDDEEAVREALGDLIERLGFRALTAEGGRVGVELFNEFNAEIFLVFVDLLMPGMGGRETCEALRALRPDIKIILSSGYDEQEMTERFATAAAGARPDIFLPKPYEFRQLVALVRAMAASAPASVGRDGQIGMSAA